MTSRNMFGKWFSFYYRRLLPGAPGGPVGPRSPMKPCDPRSPGKPGRPGRPSKPWYPMSPFSPVKRMKLLLKLASNFIGSNAQPVRSISNKEKCGKKLLVELFRG